MCMLGWINGHYISVDLLMVTLKNIHIYSYNIFIQEYTNINLKNINKVQNFEVKVLFSIFIFVYFINYDGHRVIHKIKPMLKMYHMNIS